ncbi:MAG: type II CRISPR RNA-guided endonuclease Cas9 [Chitinophagaceae bacterium]|nr:MAG: type II CRISPR RNA-guided endonuclease Cas9 [Chitinophagaceae bacterium]
MNKNILGLDLGTNSIGWALVQQDFENKKGEILGMGSRIIPMSQDVLGEFDKGISVSQTAERTRYRSTRRLRERHLLRRERLHRILNVLEFLPEHYAKEIDFEKRLGKFFAEKEPKIAYHNTDFIFKNSFEGMLNDFKKHQPELVNRKNKKGADAKIPYDWTIYYLRKKALTEKIEKKELAWLLLNFNQKRGYYQLRGEEDENSADKIEYVVLLKVMQIEKGEQDKKNDKKNWYNITLGNGWVYSATFSTEPQWLNTEKEFLVTEELDADGNIKIVKDKKTDKEGKEKRKITPLPTFEEIDLMSKKDQDKIYRKIKAKTEITISNSGKTVGTYIYDTLLQKPNQKIRGKLVRTIERKFYKDELNQILEKQKEFHAELKNENLFNDCVRELYRSNKAHQTVLSKKDFVHLFLNDIIFYQRSLKSKKSSISNCTFEFRKYKDENGKEQITPLKAVSKSHPLYQEYRVWQWLYNLSIYKKEDETNVTKDFLYSTEDYEKLFAFLMLQKEVDHKDIIGYFLKQKDDKLKGKALNTEIAKYRWNYVYNAEKDESKPYPCNETGYEIRRRLEKIENVSTDFLTSEILQALWHIIYSVKDKIEFEKALSSFAKKHKIDENSFVESFKKIKPFDNDYGSYSLKAIKKLLPLVRLGKYWKWEAIDDKTKNRISKIITGEFDENIKNHVREKAIQLTSENSFQGLQLWLASYVVYDRHSEAALAGKWDTVADLEKYLEEFKQHSLRNPIVEQVVTETLRVVKDIWKKYGNCAKDFFDEIHIELGREMKNTAEDREQITNQINDNENTNIRIKLLLVELLNDQNAENVRPHSPSQQEILKIYEDGVLNSGVEIPNEVSDILKKFKETDLKKQPTSSEVNRYKLWLEQKYRSPYTGEIIPLNKLFTSKYEIEHIIPQSRFFDNGLSNKVICEAAVNKLKDNQLGLEFIKNHHGEKVQDGAVTFEIFSVEAFKKFVQDNYAKNRSKRIKLLLEDIPEKMVERQLNDTRYISKFISSVLSSIVRKGENDDGINSKNIIPGNGKITTILKQNWGLNDVWNELILPRFERMNQLTKTESFTSKNTNNKIIPTVPLELSKGFQKKRIDHRHHALDALIIACATHDHVNLLNNQHAKSETKRYDLQRKLRKFEKVEYNDRNGNRVKREVPKDFLKPWDNFTVDAKNKLEAIVISFKQNLRVINKATNKYEKFIAGKKEKVEQKGMNWAIRKSMHKETVSGKVELPRIKVPKGKILTATRKKIDPSFDLKTIESITDTGIQKILKNYWESKDKNSELAFSPEGIEDMNKNIAQYNNGKPHQPIYKARIFELGSKFNLGQTGNKKAKYVEADKGTNLFFAVYEDEKGKRNYKTIPLNIVIERQKQGLGSVPETNENGNKLSFYLSPNDLVYVPTIEEKENLKMPDFGNFNKEQRERIYKFTDCSGVMANFIHSNIANALFNINKDKQKKSGMDFPIQNEIGVGSQGSKNERAFTGETIKNICIKLKIDRLGNISKTI